MTRAPWAVGVMGGSSWDPKFLAIRVSVHSKGNDWNKKNCVRWEV